MLECLIVGDSIAVGTKTFKPECAVMAKSGWNSAQWNRRYGLEELRAHTVIISLGSNDYAGIHTEDELRAVRARARADRVYWILPAIKPNIQEIVRYCITHTRTQPGSSTSNHNRVSSVGQTNRLTKWKNYEN